MAPLPLERVSMVPAFSHTGVDYTGEISIRRSLGSRDKLKAYIVVFTCLVTRAVHLEIVLSNSTQEFLMAFRRFINSKGFPQVVHSDNALCFKRAAKEIQSTLEVTNKKILDLSEKYHFQWNWSPPESPHSGGIWERVVSLVKGPLYKVMKGALLTYTELLTLCKEIEGQLNDRPLYEVSSDTLEVLTPSMLTLGRRLRPWVDKYEQTSLPIDLDLKERWRYRNLVAQQCWKAWKEHYLRSLQQRGKWFTKSPQIKPQDLVLVEQDNSKRHSWPVARVHQIVRGRDGLVRTVVLTRGRKDDYLSTQSSSSVVPKPPALFARSIHSVFPLEMSEGK